MAKDIKFSTEARDALMRGIDILNNSVKVTLGPQGRNVLIGSNFGTPHMTKDGVTVARHINLEDDLENMGAELIKSVASKTNDKAGDGTTTATVFTQAIIKEGLKNVVAGSNPMELKKGIDKTSKLLIEMLVKGARKIKEVEKELTQIAYISSNNDEEIGNLIGKTYAKVGKDGVISVEESKTNETTIDLVEGLQFERGYISPYFSTNKNMECELKDVKVLIYNGKLTHLKPLLPVLEATAGEGTSLLIIADSVEGEALQSLVVNKMEAGVKICAVKPPGYGERKLEYMEDFAIVTGGKLISQTKGTSLNKLLKKDNEDSTLWEKRINSYLGSCDSVKVDFHTTTLIGGKGTQEMITFREEEIRVLIENAENDYEKQKNQERLAKLQGGIGVIYVGGGSEVEVRERKDRIEDARHATKAALEEGIIPGGGIALLRIADTIGFKEAFEKLELNKEQRIGGEIVLKAIEKPFKQIIENSGGVPEVVLNKVLSTKSVSFGYDAKNNIYVKDMYKVGIIDPIKVTRIALENASSIAGMVLTTECTLIEKKADKDPTKGLAHF